MALPYSWGGQSWPLSVGQMRSSLADFKACVHSSQQNGNCHPTGVSPSSANGRRDGAVYYYDPSNTAKWTGQAGPAGRQTKRNWQGLKKGGRSPGRAITETILLGTDSAKVAWSAATLNNDPPAPTPTLTCRSALCPCSSCISLGQKDTVPTRCLINWITWHL